MTHLKTLTTVLAGLILALSTTTTPLHAAICDTAAITSKWKATICAGAENERSVTKKATHNIGVSGDCGTTGSSTPDNTSHTSSGGSSYGGWGSAASGGGAPVGGGGSPTLIEEEECVFPPCSGPECEDSGRECTGSSVLMSLGTYETSDTDLTVASRAIPISWQRSYRSNIISSIPDNITVNEIGGISNLAKLYDVVPEYYSYNNIPVSQSDGAIRTSQQSARVPVRSVAKGSTMSTSYSITYARHFALPKDGPLGYGWHSPYFERLTTNVDVIKNWLGNDVRPPELMLVFFTDGSGRQISFGMNSNGNFINKTDPNLTLLLTNTGYELWERGGSIRTFAKDGRLVTIWDRYGNHVSLRYDDEGRLSRVEDIDGRTVLSFVYLDDDRRIDQAIDAYGRIVNYHYNDFGDLVRVFDAAGKETFYSYNSQHGMLTKTNAVGETYTIEYKHPDRGAVGKVIDPLGTEALRLGLSAEDHTQSFLYDFKGRTFYVTKADGTQKKKVINDDGQLISETDVTNNAVIRSVEYLDDRVEKHTDALGNTTLIQRDEWRNVIRYVDGEGNEYRYTYNDQNKPLTITDPLGVQTRFSYDVTGTLLVEKTEAYGTNLARTTRYETNRYGEITEIDVAGATTSFAYNAYGQLIRITNAEGDAVRREYDSAGNLSAMIDGEGQRTELTSDVFGRPLTITDALNNVSRIHYDAVGRPDKITDALGRETLLTMDFKKRLVRQTNALGQVTAYRYDGNGNLVEVRTNATSDTPAVTVLDYDSYNRLTKQTDPMGNTTSYAYASAGCGSCGGSTANPQKIIDAFGHITRNSFDKNGAIAMVEDPLGNATDLTRDAGGRISSQTNANGNTTLYDYDLLGRLIHQTDANQGQTTFAYDARDNLLSLTDANGNTTAFRYDLAGRKLEETRPMGQTTTYSYNRNGLVATLSDAKNQTTTYSYDAANRLVTVHYHDGAQDSFSYDPVGNLIGYTGTDAISGVLAYDALNRKTGEIINFGTFSKEYSYSYDAYGNKDSYTSSEGMIHTYSHDLAGRLTALSVENQTLSFGYDKTRLTQISYPNGVTTTYSYNNADWLTNLTASGASGTLLSREYDFDAVGNITGALGSKGITSYTYDPTDQLTVADHPSATALSDELYSYDAVGNRLSSTDISGLISYNANNELIGHTTVQYQYDANGNTTEKTANGQTTTYDYNSRNRLSRVHLPDGRLVSYRYDPFGRRISKTVAGVTTCYTYSDEGLAAEYDANGTWQKSYGWRPDSLWGTDPVYQRTSTGIYYYHNDHLGTPQRLSDESGDIAWSVGYTAFGNATVDPILSSIDNNLRFPGQYFDQETGLHYNYQRFYDPGTGRYTQVDPIGFFAGDVNQYRYGFNTPNYWIDPTGEFVFVGAAMLIYGAIELALSIYDVYDMLSTLADPCESGISKASAVGLFLLGAVLPGGGYGAVDDIAKGANKLTKASKSAAETLPRMKGKPVAKAEKILQKHGFEQTNVSNSVAKNQTWKHADGSEVRIHPYGNQNTTPYRSANNAHIHKQTPDGNQLSDRGIISTNPSDTHIGIRNPKDLPTVRNRPHGAGTL
nr:RHS repeat-associated core domain-containing protein [uncultured Desulfuromonas sp.]